MIGVILDQSVYVHKFM